MEIVKFGRLKNVVVPDSAVEITAGNGLGKSTIVNAYCWLFTGKYADGSNPEVAIYDDRETSENWEACVKSNYLGFSIERKAAPVFETKRTGDRVLKTRVNTTIFIDNESVTEQEFRSRLNITDDFLLTATPSYFFNLEWKKQRDIINRVAIKESSELADFDLKATSDKISKLKTAQNENAKKQRENEAVLVSIKDVEVPETPAEIESAIAEYNALRSNDNTFLISEINARNNKAITEYSAKISALTKKKGEIETEIEKEKAKEFAPNLILALFPVPEAPESQETPLPTLEDFKKAHAASDFSKFPLVFANIEKVKELKAFNYENFILNNPAKCPLSKEDCATATTFAELAKRTEVENSINELIRVNKQVLENAWRTECNDIAVKNSKIRAKTTAYNAVLAENERISKENERITTEYEREFIDFTAKRESAIFDLSAKLTHIVSELDAMQAMPPTPEILPESKEIPVEILQLVEKGKALQAEINKAKGVNENNVFKKAEYEAILADLKAKFAACYSEMGNLQAQIDRYLAEMKKALKTSFSGDFDINFEFYEQTLSGEYKETFRMFVDGKEFKNTGLMLKAGVQLIAGFSKAFDIEPVVFIDNSECTSDINHLDMKCIELKFEENKQLTIK